MVLLTPDGQPGRLIRAFAEKAHLQGFLAGSVRLRRLDTYRTIEDQTRQDDMEGEARLIVPGARGKDVHYGGSFYNPVYLLCCSEPSHLSEPLKPSLGAWIASITEPVVLLSALSSAVRVPGRQLIDAMLLKVRYSKDSELQVAPSSEERYRLMLAQKPISFEAEREWRYALVLSGGVTDSPEELWLMIEDIEGMAMSASEAVTAS